MPCLMASWCRKLLSPIVGILDSVGKVVTLSSAYTAPRHKCGFRLVIRVSTKFLDLSAILFIGPSSVILFKNE